MGLFEMRIKIEKIKKQNIFTEEFLALKTNNEVDLKSKGICVFYGPNGTGKTSLSKVLKKEKGSEYTINIDGETFTQNSEEKIAHIISDQNDRNIIEGNTQDFILGNEIKREYELKEQINNSFNELFTNKLVKMLKVKYGISTKKSNFDDLVLDSDYLGYISDIANTRQKGKGIDRESFIEKVYSEEDLLDVEFNEQKLQFFINDYGDKNSTIKSIINYKFNLNEKDKKIAKLEEQNEAVKILNKYEHLDDCIVCDNHINSKELIKKKSEDIDGTKRTLTKEEQEIAEKIIEGLPMSDPFMIRDKIFKAINLSERGFIDELVEDFNSYKSIYWKVLKRDFVEEVKSLNIKNDNDEYQKLIQNKPEFDGEDIMFIEKFLNETLERKITLERDKDNNIKLLLGGDEFLQVQRQNLSLSNGEQNFLSLAFELLKAKNIDSKFIVLDDPVSSFDSIYKNKLAYAIISFLREKKVIVLTHNTDLIKLLEHQRPKCINLYYFNNVLGENNGFIPVNKDELTILLYIHEFLALLRIGIKEQIKNKKHFLISIAPFMRGFCQIIGDKKSKDELTKLMHGYNDEKVNLTAIYKTLFGEVLDELFDQDFLISAKDIVSMDSDKFEPLKNDAFPLLSKSLRHTMNYLYLRLNVEKKLADTYKIDTDNADLLSQIILAAFPLKKDTDEKKAHRVFFMSRKTLLNDFNHFEMDMNIFQPAIDITDKSLNREKQQILDRLSTINP